MDMYGGVFMYVYVGTFQSGQHTWVTNLGSLFEELAKVSSTSWCNLIGFLSSSLDNDPWTLHVMEGNKEMEVMAMQ